MICTGDSYKVENYKEYKNRTMKKHIDKINNQVLQIKHCSLKKEDKEKLRQQMLEAVKSFNI